MNTVYLNAQYVGADLYLKGNVFIDTQLNGVLKLSSEVQKLTAKIFTEKTLTGNLSTDIPLQGVASVGLSATPSSYPFYKGEYEVVPKRQEQVLDTDNKILTKDITVVEIPYSEVSNLGGGSTFYIARE